MIKVGRTLVATVLVAAYLVPGAAACDRGSTTQPGTTQADQFSDVVALLVAAAEKSRVGVTRVQRENIFGGAADKAADIFARLEMEIGCIIQDVSGPSDGMYWLTVGFTKPPIPKSKVTGVAEGGPIIRGPAYIEVVLSKEQAVNIRKGDPLTLRCRVFLIDWRENAKRAAKGPVPGVGESTLLLVDYPDSTLKFRLVFNVNECKCLIAGTDYGLAANGKKTGRRGWVDGL